MTAPAIATAASYTALDAAYRAAVARTSAGVIRILFSRWATVDSRNLAGTSNPWLRDSIEAILAGQRNAAALANSYAEQVRRLSLPDEPLFTPPPQRPPNIEQIRKSLIFTGIASTGQELGRLEATRDSELESPDVDRESAERTEEGRRQQLMQDAFARAAGAAIRHITTAGFDQLEDVVRADKKAIGWARSTKPGCCYFCAMLASRGYVYKEDSFKESNARFSGMGDQKVHDTCGCGLRPLYSTSDPLPDRVEALEQMWVDMTRETGKSGRQAVNEFRRRYEASELALAA